MSIAKWVLLGWYALSVLITIGQIGKPRKPLTTDATIVTVILCGVLAWLVVIA